MDFGPDKIQLTGLENLVKALGSKSPPKIKIGILGNSGARRGSGPSNVEIGTAHEFGAPARNLPQRSFLRMPLTTQFSKDLEASHLLTEDELKAVLAQGTLVPWLRAVKTIAEGTVRMAFQTEGFGTWPAWKRAGYTNNANMILTDTGQLRDSISSEIVNK